MQHNSKIKSVLITEEQLKQRIVELGAQITRDYVGKKPLIVGVLKGAWIFLADLLREIDLEVDVDFIAASSYGGGTESSGRILLTKDLTTGCEERDVIVVEDIVDSGVTLTYLKDMFLTRQVKSCAIVTLLDKPSRRKVQLTPDYVGFEIPNEFIVGYGLDYNEDFRNLKDICILKEEVFNK